MITLEIADPQSKQAIELMRALAKEVNDLYGDEGESNLLSENLFRRGGVSIAALCVPVIAALICTTKRSVEGVKILD